MEIFSVGFFAALGAIFFLNLILSGDNAVVIALAARHLPEKLQRRAIFWGAAGAICVRIIMTLVAFELLNLPGLQLAGGLLLVWIASGLLKPESEEREGEGGKRYTTFWEAMRTIILADAVMGVDNVLAIAGVSNGNMMLVVIGLALSVPIVMLGSTIVLTLLQRFPVLVYLGAAILAFTGAEMIVNEPLIGGYIAAMGDAVHLIHVVLVVGVILFGIYCSARQHKMGVTKVD